MAALGASLSGPITVLLCAGLLALARACSAPPGGCTASKCHLLNGLQPPSGPVFDPRIGYNYGIWNRNTAVTKVASERGAPAVNYEVFPQIETAYWIVDTESKGITSLAECCNLCARTPNCTIFNFYTNINPLQITTSFGVKAAKLPNNWPSSTLARQCYLLTGGTDKSDGNADGAPWSGTHSTQISSTYKVYAPSWVGGHCNGSASVINDPHFTGALGTRFEFNGDIDKTFCLVTDTRLHINMKLGGFEDDNSVGATVMKNGKALRTWIREIGILWAESDGTKHTALLTARRGKQQERGSGFIASFVVDGKDVPVPRQPGDRFKQGDFAFQLDGVTKQGWYDLEKHTLVVAGLVELGVDLRVAHPLLQTKDDAQVHFNIHIKKLEVTDKIHGVLGQTYRKSVSQTLRALEYSLLARLLQKPVVADGDTGLGFLDGTPKDYQTSGLLSSDCAFSSYTA